MNKARPSASRRRSVSRRRASWRSVLIGAVVGGVLVTLGIAGLGALLSGTAAAVAAVTAGGAAVVLTGTSLLLVDLTERRAPQLILPVFMLGFAVKVSVLALVLMVAPRPEELHAGWAVGAVVAVVTVQQVAVVRGFATMRMVIAPVTER